MPRCSQDTGEQFSLVSLWFAFGSDGSDKASKEEWAQRSLVDVGARTPMVTEYRAEKTARYQNAPVCENRLA